MIPRTAAGAGSPGGGARRVRTGSRLPLRGLLLNKSSTTPGTVGRAVSCAATCPAGTASGSATTESVATALRQSRDCDDDRERDAQTTSSTTRSTAEGVGSAAMVSKARPASRSTDHQGVDGPKSTSEAPLADVLISLPRRRSRLLDGPDEKAVRRPPPSAEAPTARRPTRRRTPTRYRDRPCSASKLCTVPTADLARGVKLMSIWGSSKSDVWAVGSAEPSSTSTVPSGRRRILRVPRPKPAARTLCEASGSSGLTTSGSPTVRPFGTRPDGKVRARRSGLSSPCRRANARRHRFAASEAGSGSQTVSFWAGALAARAVRRVARCWSLHGPAPRRGVRVDLDRGAPPRRGMGELQLAAASVGSRASRIRSASKRRRRRAPTTRPGRRRSTTAGRIARCLPSGQTSTRAGSRAMAARFVGSRERRCRPGDRVVPSPVSANLKGLFGFGANDIWAVGDEGTVIHWDGRSGRSSRLPSTMPKTSRTSSRSGEARPRASGSWYATMLHFQGNAP